MSVEHEQGLLDTNIMILRKWIDTDELPAEMAISTSTLAELSAGPHQVRGGDEQSDYDEHAERARRMDVLQRAEERIRSHPLRRGGGPCLRQNLLRRRLRRSQTPSPCGRLMIAAIAAAEELPLFTTNPDDFKGLDGLITIVPVTPMRHDLLDSEQDRGADRLRGVRLHDCVLHDALRGLVITQ